MKIAVSMAHGSLDAEIDPRFGRCHYFLIVETDDLSFEAIENPNVSLGGGAGIQSAQLVANRGVQYVLTGNCGPNAYKVLSAGGIGIISGCSGPVREAIAKFKDGGYSPAAEANVPSHSGIAGSTPDVEFAANSGAAFGSGGGCGIGGGMGGGGGRGTGGGCGRGMRGGGGQGMGRGGGRGMGGGMGRTMTAAPVLSQTGSALNYAATNELDSLNQKAMMLSQQLQQIQSRMNKLQNSGQKSVAIIDGRLCTGCGVCAKICPQNAIRIYRNRASVNEDACIGCGACAVECPAGAITLS